MSTLRFTRTTTATPQQLLEALTDFGPGRSEVFPNSRDDALTVHELGPGFADVTEGGSGFWERLRYDWSDPTRVVMTTTDSNVWGGRSGHTYTFTALPDGTTRLDVVVVREGKNLRGRVVGVLVGTVARRVIERALDTTVSAVEARGGPRPTASA
ncbi:hypothetical protein Cch01nite_07410 [Cellulomonas chitinilytica]|uniref:SRPBCC family protein n=1 Tax=Cellulomonas chitinilytica TaxID=398759 RepID=A0A919U0Z7_9CELL|nr:SRPBCC family protein [Cellulomonas chitinilytica]GIG20017.1 hypothetical protein Cch01nite_07410 [Cellulomonas chitinilytica]